MEQQKHQRTEKLKIGCNFVILVHSNWQKLKTFEEAHTASILESKWGLRGWTQKLWTLMPNRSNINSPNNWVKFHQYWLKFAQCKKNWWLYCKLFPIIGKKFAKHWSSFPNNLEFGCLDVCLIWFWISDTPNIECPLPQPRNIALVVCLILLFTV